jgi:hypothetical protein
VTLLALAYVLLLGLPTASCFARRGHRALAVGVTPFVGWLALTIPWIVSALTGLPVSGWWWWQALLAALGLAGVATLLLGRARATTEPRQEPRWLVAATASVLGIAAIALLAAGIITLNGEPPFRWDGLVIWLVRSKVLAGATGAYPGHLATDQVWRGHWDYPLLYPAFLAWLQRAGGLEVHQLGLGLGVIAGVIPLAGWLPVRHRLHPALAAAALLSVFCMFELGFHHYGAYADGFLTLSVTVALVWMFVGVRDRDTGFLTAAGLALATATCIKNEGVLWLMAVTLAAAAYAASRGQGARIALNVALRVGLLGVALYVSWRIACTRMGISNDLMSALQWGKVVDRLSTVPVAVLEVLFLPANLPLLVPLLVALVALAPGGARHRAVRVGALLSAPAIAALGFTCIYLLTRHDPMAHMRASAVRVTYPVAPAVFVALLFARDRSPPYALWSRQARRLSIRLRALMQRQAGHCR